MNNLLLKGSTSKHSAQSKETVTASLPLPPSAGRDSFLLQIAVNMQKTSTQFTMTVEILASNKQV